MWKPWQQASGWGHASNERAIGNARSAATLLSRRRVEREEVELFLRDRATRPVPLPGVAPGVAPRPA
ncbi:MULTISPECIES: hypothetical protein [unclassified Nocardioides]|uniref:hypothetical protein n=1 Tax=unclassified Nocardioides TaxID=2615069 RepID=UPI000B3375C8|nr:MULTISPECIES: hypothetical protein [unclassified Nocardioides]